MNDNSLPRETLRTLGVLLVLAFDFALERGRHAIERLAPMVEPPEDLRVSSTTGCLYSGIVVLDRGEVLAGIVVATGFDPIRAATARAAAVASGTPFPRHEAPLVRRDPTTGLPHWSEDRSLYDDGDPPWRR
jgi:hypothetical protein